MTKESSGINDVSKEILDVVKEIKDDIAKKDEKKEENEVNSEDDEETENDAEVTEETVEMVETLAEMKNNIAKGSIERGVKARPKRKKLEDPLFVYVEKMKKLKKPNDTSMEITVTEKGKMVSIDDDSDDEDFEDPPLEAGKMLNLSRCRNFKMLTAEEKNIIMKDWYAYRKSDLVWCFQEEWINITVEQLEELLANSFVNGSTIDFFVWKLKKEGTERKFSYIHHFDCIQVVDACLLYAYDSNNSHPKPPSRITRMQVNCLQQLKTSVDCALYVCQFIANITKDGDFEGMQIKPSEMTKLRAKLVVDIISDDKT